MTSNYKFIDHTADVAIEVSGSTYAELFIAALAGWKDSVIRVSTKKRELKNKEIVLEEYSIEELLVSYLQELNYLFENKKLFPAGLNNIHIEKTDDRFLLRSVIRFASVTSDDEIKTEIKAVTFHQLDIKKVNDVYKTIMVFDI